MKMKFCFRRFVSLHPPFFDWICIDIPIYLDRDRFKIPQPDPPWLHGEKINPEAIRDLSTIATIEKMAGLIGNAKIKGLFSTTIKNAVGELDLPSEMRVELGGQVIREHCEAKE